MPRSLAFKKIKWSLFTRRLSSRHWADEYVYLPASDTCGGILLAWKSRDVSITDPRFTTNTLSSLVATPTGVSVPWWLTIVYGPQTDNDKITFL